VSHHGILNQPLAYTTFEIADIVRRESVHGWFYLTSSKTKALIPGAAVNLTFHVEVGDKVTQPVIEKRSDKLLKIAKLKEEAKKIADPKDTKDDKLRLFIGSWNVGNAVPPEDLSPWIPKSGFDLYAIGSQECSYDHRKPYGSCNEDWIGTLTNHFGTDYSLIETSHLWQIRLVIFCKKSLFGQIHTVEKSTEATGIASVMGNKGGTAKLVTKQQERRAQKSMGDSLTNLKVDWCKVKGYKYTVLPNGSLNIQGVKDLSNTSINMEEFGRLMTAMNPDDLKALFNLYDCDHNGTITWREYICVITLIMNGSLEKKIRLIFNCFDDDGNGVLSKEEFKKAVERFSDTQGDVSEFTNRVFKECDANGDNEVSFQEFFSWVQTNKETFEQLAGVLCILNMDD